MLLGKSKFLSNLSPKKKQYLIACLLGVVVVGFMVLVFVKVTGALGTARQVQHKPKVSYTNTNIASAGSRSDPQEIWRYKNEDDKEKIKEELESIKKAFSESMEYFAVKEASNDYEHLKEEVSELKKLILLNQNSKIEEKEENHVQEVEQGIERIVFNLAPKKVKKNKNIEESIPTGAFARAVILGGVDAATTINAASDPRPMLVRLVDPGTLPRRFKSDLKDCHVVASSYGDLSSERVYARLEKLSCVERESGAIIETQVAGYIAGEDGRVGIRGVVVEKGQKYLANSIVGGLLQGVAGILTPEQGFTMNAFGISQEQNSALNRFSKGAGNGISKSMDRLSQYYIERAEILQPVIQVAAGRIVDVVFNEGAEIGTELIREKIEARRAKAEEIEFKEGWD